LGPDERLRHKLFTYKDSFLYEYARFLLHKRLVSEGMLSPYANPFYPQMDMVYRTMERYNEKTKLNIDKLDIAEQLNKDPQNIILKEDTPITKENDEWTKVKQTIPNEIEVKEKINTGKRSYNGLTEKSDAEGKTREELINEEGEATNMRKDMKTNTDIKDYNVNTMTLREMDEVLKEVIEECQSVEITNGSVQDKSSESEEDEDYEERNEIINLKKEIERVQY